MKKIFISLLSILLALSAAGCGYSGKKSSDNTSIKETTPITSEATVTEITSISTNQVATSPLFVEKSKIEETVNDDDGSVLINASFELPVIKNENNSPEIQKINDYFKKASDEYFERLRAKKQEVKEDKSLNSGNFPVYVYDRTFEVTYNKSGFLSILQLDYVNLGGAHPSTERVAKTFDITTGEAVNITDILKGTDKEINDMIAQAFNKIVSEKPDDFFDTAKDTIADGNPYGGFYLTDHSIMFFYQTEVLAPYAFGYPEFGIAYTNSEKFNRVME